MAASVCELFIFHPEVKQMYTRRLLRPIMHRFEGLVHNIMRGTWEMQSQLVVI